MNSYIAMVDDDSEDVEILKDALFAIGSQTPFIQYVNGEKLLEDLANGSALPCLLVVDLSLPKLSGIDLIGLLKGNQDIQGTPLIVLSTSANPTEIETLDLLKVRYFKKPDTHAGWKAVSEEIARLCLEHVSQNQPHNL